MATHSEAKQEAEQFLRNCQEAYNNARAELRQARADLDEILREEEAANHAVFIGFEPGDEDGIRAAKKLIERRRAQKAADREAGASEADGPIGGVA